MNDPILPDDATEPMPEAPQAPPAPQASGDSDRIGALERHMVELTQAIRDTAQRLVAPQAASVNPDEFLNEMASDPRGVMERVARETYQRQAGETLNPAVMQVLDMARQQLLREHELRVDGEFGTGTWNEVFKPQLDKDMEQLKQVNPRAIADPATVDALVNRQFGGGNFEKLVARRQAVEDGRMRGATNLVPTGGYPRLRSEAANEVPGDVEGFLRDVERSTGENIDRKNFAKLYHTGRESGPGRHRTSLLDYLRATGADPDTLKHYGGERGR